MQDSTRRAFLALAGTSAVAGAALTTAPAAGAAPTAATEAESLPRGAEKALAVYVRDTAKGELVLMSNDGEVVVTDHKLVARLARAFAQAAR